MPKNAQADNKLSDLLGFAIMASPVSQHKELNVGTDPHKRRGTYIGKSESKPLRRRASKKIANKK